MGFLRSIVRGFGAGGLLAVGVVAWLFASGPALAQTQNGQQVEGQKAEYQLGSGDQLRITFFGKHTADLSGEYEIDGSGLVPLPLVGSMRLGGLTLAQAEKAIVAAYQPDYVLNPRVSLQVLNYRPFYIMGQVNEPGSYPYVNGITVLEAIVIAGGFTKRAKESRMTIIRSSDPSREKQDVAPDTIVLPGDVIEVPQRYF